jgi:hypothetical protein
MCSSVTGLHGMPHFDRRSENMGVPQQGNMGYIRPETCPLVLSDDTQCVKESLEGNVKH